MMGKSARIVVFVFFLFLTFVVSFTVNSILIKQESDKKNMSFLASNQESILSKERTPTLRRDDGVSEETVRKFLADMEAQRRQSLDEFYQNNSYNQERTKQLIENLGDILTTPIPTLNPDLEKVLADVSENQLNTEWIPGLTPGMTKRWVPGIDVPLPAEKTMDENTAKNVGILDENPVKNTHLIALLGDSMTETLGSDFSYLENLLRQKFPKYSFPVLNYGMGSTDMEHGFYRLTHSTNYLGKEYPPLTFFQPDILVVESFAYNHWSGNLYDLDRQWLTIAKIIDTILDKSPQTKIVLAATISPNGFIFGDGKLNWPQNLKWDSTIITKAYLQNIINFATSQYFPLADAYTPSMGEDKQGNSKYINSSDNLHPSDEGKKLYLQRIAEAIINNHLIN